MASPAEQRQAVADLVDLALSELHSVWRALGPASAEQVRDALMDALPAIGQKYGDAAAALAYDWFTDQRELADVKRAFEPIMAPPLKPARMEALARWGVDPLFQPTPDRDAALALVAGGLQRAVADQHRSTVTASALLDPEASGWRRVGVGDTCGFCRMLIDRGGVYTGRSVQFLSHDNCNCVAAPWWGENVRKVIGVPYRTSQRKNGWSEQRKARENQRVYEWIKAQGWD